MKLALAIAAAVVLAVIFGAAVPGAHRAFFWVASEMLAWAARVFFFTPGDWLVRAAGWCRRQAGV